MTVTARATWRRSPDALLPRRGLWVTFLGPYGLEVIGSAVTDGTPALEWLGIDLQHGDVGVSDLPSLLRATSLPVLARLASRDGAHVGRVLDAGVAGIIAPGVETATEAAAIVAAAHAPPRGQRSTGGCRATLVGVFADPLVLVMIETAEGLSNAASIADVAGVDGVFVGPYDLSLSIGADSAEDPLALTAIETALRPARDRGLVTGLFAGNPTLAERFRDVDVLAVDSDVAVFRIGVLTLFGRSAAGDRSTRRS